MLECNLIDLLNKMKKKQNRWKIYNAILEKYANFCHEELVIRKNILKLMNI